MKTAELSRFDARLPKEQKEYFEYAANLGGFRNLTDFVMFSIKQSADNIVERHNIMLASKRDQDIFFTAITNPPSPNSKLKKAAARYTKVITAK